MLWNKPMRTMAVMLAFAVVGIAARVSADTALVFNEVMYHPATNEPALEWVEFHNQMAVDLDVSGWRVAGDIEYTFPEGAVVPGQGYVVLALEPVVLGAATGLDGILGPYTGRLANDGGTLELLNRDGRRMDRFRWDSGGEWPVTADGAGPSLAKADRERGSEAPEHWLASEQIGGTPGAENFPASGRAVLGVAFNESSGTGGSTYWVEVVNHSQQSVGLGGWVVCGAGSGDAAFTLPPDAELGPGEHLVLGEAALGFRPLDGDRLFLYTPGRERAADGIVVEARGRARHPEGTGRWRQPSEPTPGSGNRFAFEDRVVLNEILYRHARLVSTNGAAPERSSEQWVELYNRGSTAVDLAGWELEGGIEYRFGAGQRLGPGEYLVVARDAAALRRDHPGVEIVGDFTGQLSARGETIRLEDAFGNPADEVRYFDRGHWPGYADGGGSSLELRDPFADNACAEAWAASDETGASGWQAVSYRMTAGYPAGTQPTQWNDFILGLLGAGECLVDDLAVIEMPGGAPVALVGNGDFESGLAGWRLLGTHRGSRVIVDPADPGNHVLHLIASGPQEHMHNHVETTLSNGRSVVNGREYQVSFRARWLGGNNRLNTRLYFNRVARTTVLEMPARNGTPGARNSRYTANLGPTFKGFRHAPVVPNAGASVTVTVAVGDPQGIASASLRWSVNGGVWNSVALAEGGGGEYAGSIPGQAAGAIVQFYVQAVDGLGAVAAYPPAGPDSGALYVVKDGQFDASRGHNLRLVLTPANRDLLHTFTNVMSNAELPGTVICDERRAYYDVGVRLKGSQRGRYSDTRVSFHLTFQPDDLFRDVHPVMLIDRSGAGDSTSNKQLEILIKHLVTRVGGIAGPPADLCKVIAPRSAHSGSAILAPRHEDEYVETASEAGGDGTIYELELIYYPTTANAAGYKNPQPDNVLGVDLQDLGIDPELYRYNFLIKNHRDADDYRPFMRLARALSLTGAALEQQSRAVMDIDAWMRAWALVTLCGVSDSYTFGNDHNLMMYCRPGDGRFVPFPVDMDFSFVRGATSGLVGDRNLSRVINLPANLRVFYAHVLDVIGRGFNAAYMTPWIGHYNRFVPEQNYASIADYIRRRANHAADTIAAAGGNAAFALAGTNRIVTARNQVTLSGTAPVALRTLLVNGVAWPVTWGTLTQWTVNVPVTGATNLLELTGLGLDGMALPGAAATVTVICTGPDIVPEGQVVLNEIMYNPALPEASFVELHNRSSDTAFDVSGWRVDGLDFTFPPGSSLAAGGYLVLAGDRGGYLDAYGLGVPLPWAFFPGNLQNEGETLTLVRPGGTPGEEVMVDQVTYAGSAPWPTAANGLGPSLQLVDSSQDNRRVANWAAADASGAGEPRWVEVVARGTASSSSFYMYLESAGDIYLDDVRIVPGAVPGVGVNSVQNGDFESPLSGPWVVSPNHAGSALSVAVKHGGNSSLHLVASSGGSTRASSIYQELAPALVAGQPYTLSFWYRQSANGGPLTLRLSLHGITVTVDPAPTAVGPYTPGAANSVARELAPFPALWLNEVQPINQTGSADNRGEREPWIELYNAGATPSGLDGLFLATRLADLTQWALPSGLTIDAGGYLRLWADAEPAESDEANLHTGFRLDGGAGMVMLVREGDEGPEVLDYLEYESLAVDTSYGSLPDGEPVGRRVLFHPTPGSANRIEAEPGVVLINEWMAANTASSGIADPADNRFQDWFELFNPGARDVRLDGWFLSDDPTLPFKNRIPAGYLVPAGGYLLVWADEESEQNQPGGGDLHVNFRLSQEGEAIVLSRPDGSVADAVAFGGQTPDVSQGRSPDGGASIEAQASPTPRGANVWVPPAPPEFTEIRLDAEGGVWLGVRTIPGQRYGLESRDELGGGGGWTSMGESQTADATSMVFHPPVGVQPCRFYRVVVVRR